MTETVVALGFFDGVHLGHGALLRRARLLADNLGCQAVALSFDRHPSALLAGQSVPLINTPEDRQRLMLSLYGMDRVALIPFTREFMNTPWDQFVRECLVQGLHARHVVCGHDYRFGRDGAGTPQTLAVLCRQLGLGCDCIPRVELDGVTVSSTAIRRFLSQGQLDKANRFLGHPHLLSGPVIHGNRLGVQLGFPTANVALPQGLVEPLSGVYATKVLLHGQWYPAVTNVGTHPTVGQSSQVLAESWILDFSGDLYGKTISIHFCSFLRPEKKFASLEELKAAVLDNARQARQVFAQGVDNSGEGR